MSFACTEKENDGSTKSAVRPLNGPCVTLATALGNRSLGPYRATAVHKLLNLDPMRSGVELHRDSMRLGLGDSHKPINVFIEHDEDWYDEVLWCLT